MATMDEIKKIFDSYGVPERIWKPIISTESGGNSNAVASTSTELSKGLFQINVMAHPQYANLNLYDPIVNTNIAAKYFISPAYEQAKQITTDPKQQALIVYSGLKNPNNPKEGYLNDGAGIRPLWTENTKNRFINNYESQLKNPSDAKQFQDYMLDEKGNKVYNNPSEWASKESPKSNNLYEKAIDEMNSPPVSEVEKSLAFSQNLVKVFSIISLIIVIIIALFMIFNKTSVGKNITGKVSRGVKAYATGGMSEITEGGGK